MGLAGFTCSPCDFGSFFLLDPRRPLRALEIPPVPGYSLLLPAKHLALLFEVTTACKAGLQFSGSTVGGAL